MSLLEDDEEEFVDVHSTALLEVKKGKGLKILFPNKLLVVIYMATWTTLKSNLEKI